MSLTEPCSLCEMEARKIYAAIFGREILASYSTVSWSRRNG